MARHNDPELEGRILKAAKEIWRNGGEAALHMRAIAKAAGTNTPAIYRRFHAREDILRTLVLSYQRDLFRSIEDCTSLSEIADCMIDFALQSPQEYQLMSSGVLARMTSERPNFYFVAQSCAEWMGGQAKDYEGLVFAVFAVVHGTVMLTVSNMIPRSERSRSRQLARRAIDTLVANARKLRGL